MLPTSTTPIDTATTPTTTTTTPTGTTTTPTGTTTTPTGTTTTPTGTTTTPTGTTTTPHRHHHGAVEHHAVWHGRLVRVHGAGLPPLHSRSSPRMIDFDHFLEVDMRVGRVIAVDDFPQARKPAWKLTIDFGAEIGHKRSSAQITHYPREQLLDTLVVGVVNFPSAPDRPVPIRGSRPRGAGRAARCACCCVPTPMRNRAHGSADEPAAREL